MSNSQLKKAQRAIQNLTDEELRIINKEIFESGFNSGWDSAMAMAEKYLDPVFRDMNATNFITGQIIGVASAGFGEIAQENIKELCAVLSEFIGRMDFELERASQVFGDDIREVFDGSFVQQLYKTAKRYYSTGDSRPLQDLVETKNPVISGLLSLRPSHGPGAKHKKVIMNQWLFEYAQQFKNETGSSWSDVAEMFLRRMI